MTTPEETLRTLLHRAVEQTLRHGKTLVLVTPEHLELSPAFYVALATAWRDANASGGEVDSTDNENGKRSMPQLRIDWCPSESDRFGWESLRAAWKIRRCKRALRRADLDHCLDLTRCLLIGKSSQRSSTLVMGIVTEATALPSWTTPVPMAA